MSVDGTPSFRLMAWSHGHSGGNFLDSLSLKTFQYRWYDDGTLSLVCFSTFPLHILIGGSCVVQAVNFAIAASGARSTMGSWE